MKTCNEDGKCNQSCCEKCLEFEKRWSSVSGAIAAFDLCIFKINEKAKDAFIFGDDVIANKLRILSKEIFELVELEKANLRWFIKKGRR